jgi:hypothetical protein
VSMVVSSLLFVALLAIGIAHLLWSCGATWPIQNRTLLARAISGAPGVTEMPPRLRTFGIALVIFGCGLLALALADHDSGGLWLSALGTLAGAAFLGRGIVGYTAWWKRLTPEEPFRTLDRKNYSPLCLLLGAGFLILVILRFL